MAPFFGIEIDESPLAGLRATPLVITEAVRRACERLSCPQPEPPVLVSAHTFKQWVDTGIIVERTPGSGDWVFT